MPTSAALSPEKHAVQVAACTMATCTALSMLVPANVLGHPHNVAEMFEDELEMESTLHVTGFTSAACHARFAGVASDLDAPPTSAHPPFASGAAQASVAQALSSPRGIDTADPDDLPPLKRGRSGKALAACLATPAEPAERFSRVRVVTQPLAESNPLRMSEEVEEAMDRVRRWLDVTRRMRVRQARQAMRAAASALPAPNLSV